jgi:hypothetical protein
MYHVSAQPPDKLDKEPTEVSFLMLGYSIAELVDCSHGFLHRQK